jgi:dihydroorotate dehydrogenase electron transfer subunit
MHLAEALVHQQVPIIEQSLVARQTARLRLRAPELAARAVPGQFFMLRIPDCNDPLIGRPLALFDVCVDDQGRPQDIEVVYVVKGKLTTALARLRVGQQVEIWGPLGNGFSIPPVQTLVLVAGGIGHTPMLALGKEALGLQRYGDSSGRQCGYAERVVICYGARSADLLAGVDRFEAAGFEVHLSTDDQSAGSDRLVTDSLERLLRSERFSCVERARSEADEPQRAKLMVACCGPEPMMAAVSRMTLRAGVDCQVSLETPMACGIGICFSCVAKARSRPGAESDYVRTCVEGPVFSAASIDWDEA